jgi:ABC-type sugar transport system ATPase subunit
VPSRLKTLGRYFQIINFPTFNFLTPLIRFQNISKRFPGVAALTDVSFHIETGACHALVGENGAGKSTLGKILAGIYPHDEGEIRLDDRSTRFAEPRDALQMGIGIVHQEMVFCENLSVAENLCLGTLPTHGPLVSHRLMDRRARQMLATIEADIDVHQLISTLSVGQQQLVQIAAAIGSGARVLIFDEPTSSLSHVEAVRLFKQIERLKSQGVTTIYISHHLDEIFRLCDAVTVLRDGQHVATNPIGMLDEALLINLMIGRTLETYFPTHMQSEPGEEVFRVENLSSPGKFEDISFTVHAGEVVGLAGLVGAGRTEVLEALFGLDTMARGQIYISSRPVHIRHPIDAMQLGIGLVPEDRKRYGLVLSLCVRDNIALPTLERRAQYGWVRTREENTLAQTYVKQLNVRTPSLDETTAGLSGGNQQKLVLAKWLAAQCRILFIDEPTRGVDVGAKSEMHALIDQLAHDGTAIVMVSSELPEVLNLSTRILVLRDGHLAGILAREDADQVTVMQLMAGVA